MASIAPKKFVTVCLSLFLLGCSQNSAPVPEDQTSLSLDPGIDPGKPSQRLTMIWHHHSTGQAILDGGLSDALKKNNIECYSMYYDQAEVDGYVIGDHSDPQDFPRNFNTPEYFETIKSWGLSGDKQQHDIVMFKSCFPASNINSDAMLDQYKEYYNSLLNTFKNNPEILFIAMSTPPLVKAATTQENAKRARQWAKWITEEYAQGIPNVKVFDLFNSLAIIEGNPNENTLVPQFAESKTDSHPAAAGAKAVTRMFIPWLNRVVRERIVEKPGNVDG
ncbi:MAG: hypothetical protein JW746_00675 [Candidatus Krumholzibacteriota bacterium]|nr:hypothetical protein [Candidatus Krumholzibacteriota bacterium]